MKRLLCGLLWMFLTGKAGAGMLVQTPFEDRFLPPGYYRGSGPAFITKMPDAIPESPVPPVSLYRPDPPFARTLAWLDGEPVHRALFSSLIDNPVERALVVHDFQHSGFRLNRFEIEGNFRRYQKAQFHGIDALRDLRLQKEHATLDDYRRYVAEEVAIHTMLYTVSHQAATWAEQSAVRKAYLARLRRKAVIENQPS